MPTPDLLGRIALEIDDRLRQLQPAVEEHERLLTAASAMGLDELAPKPPGRPAVRARAAKPARGRPAGSGAAKARAAKPSAEKPSGSGPRGEIPRAILAALEHGSHTVAELVVVTALSPPVIRRHAAALLKGGAIARASRDGKSAYALARTPG